MVNLVTPFNTQKWDVNEKESSRIRRSLTLKAKISLFVAIAMVILTVIVLAVCFAIPKGESKESIWPSYKSHSRMGKYSSAAVSTDAAPCAPIGRDILQRNGSAMDAAIAVLVCMGAHNPHSMGLGGGFLMMYYNRTEQRAYYMDARETAPRHSSEDMFHGNSKLAVDGGLSIAVPGELAGYVQAHRQFGVLPWAELLKPTIEMCKKGILVSAHMEKAIDQNLEAMKKSFRNLGDVFLKNNSEGYRAGEFVKMPALARTLEAIAELQMRAIYGPSPLSDQFIADLKSAGSIIDKIDLQDYSPRMRVPVKVGLRNGTTLYSASLPGSGALLGFMMAVLDGYEDLGELVKQDRRKIILSYHRMVEALKYGFAHRFIMEDEDDEDMRLLLHKLTSRSYADEIRGLIDDTRTFNSSHYGEDFGFVEDHGTAHMSIVAPNGDAVSVTSTINMYFGSKVLSPSTGLILNNEMDDFSSPNITNNFELPPTATRKNSIRPGKRPMSSMTPMILVDAQGDVKLVLGGNGGTAITTGVLQVAARNLFFNEDIKASIDAPRIHHQLTPDVLHYESNFPEALAEELRKLGHKAQKWTKSMMSIIMGIARGDDGLLYANSDYKKGGDVDGF